MLHTNAAVVGSRRCRPIIRDYQTNPSHSDSVVGQTGGVSVAPNSTMSVVAAARRLGVSRPPFGACVMTTSL